MNTEWGSHFLLQAIFLTQELTPDLLHCRQILYQLRYEGSPKLKDTMKLKDAFFARKAMTNLDHIIKSRDITLTKEVCLVKAMIFPGVMCGCERWTVKKAEH